VEIAHLTRSCGSPREGNRAGRAIRSLCHRAQGRKGELLPGRRRCEPNASEPDSASLDQPVVTNLQTEVKSDTSGEEMSASTRWATRGGWGGRVPTDRAGTWDTRLSESVRREGIKRCARVPMSRVRRKGRKRKCASTAQEARGRRQRDRGIHNPGRGSSRESDRPIVALKRGNARGAKGPSFSHVFVKERKPA
jgi:hypothetical protein